MHFSFQTYTALKSKLRRRYKLKLHRVVRELSAFPKTQTHKWIILNSDELEEFTPPKWYFLKQVESLVFFLSRPIGENCDDEFTPDDDVIFEKWNQSEFADVFLKLLNRGFNVRKASLETAKILDAHLVQLGNFHLLKMKLRVSDYRLQPSLGDVQKKSNITKLLETTLHIDGKELVLMTSTLKEMKDFSSRIETALKLIRQYSPSSWERFKVFTETIIPIKQEELVSYSHQELPGTSMINLYNRDFIDLLDDLIHENGHHHLNYYLNLQKLIDEPIDCIYYSPWRRSLRPLRGIFHAYFTFYWAFKLFSDLALKLEEKNPFYDFNSNEKEKIIWRAVEEYYMLNYTFVDLKFAKSNGLIREVGWQLISEQQNSLKKFKSKISLWEKKLKNHKSELAELKKTLKISRRKFSQD